MQKWFLSIVLGTLATIFLIGFFAIIDFIFAWLIAFSHNHPDVPMAGILGSFVVTFLFTLLAYFTICDIENEKKIKVKKLLKRKSK